VPVGTGFGVPPPCFGLILDDGALDSARRGSPTCLKDMLFISSGKVHSGSCRCTR
jgi:hypothetical protein